MALAKLFHYVPLFFHRSLYLDMMKLRRSKDVRRGSLAPLAPRVGPWRTSKKQAGELVLFFQDHSIRTALFIPPTQISQVLSVWIFLDLL